MKIELDDNTSSFLTGGVICLAIASVIIGISYFIYDYNKQANLALQQAPTCEARVAMIGGPNMAVNIIACKAQTEVIPSIGK